jgi:ketosteroid isomerase-like protein
MAFSSAAWADPEIEFVWADGPDPGSWQGIPAMAEAARSRLSTADDLRAVADDYRELDDERILVSYRRVGRAKHTGMNLAQVRSRGANVFHVREGKVTRLVTYVDSNHALADLGLES